MENGNKIDFMGHSSYVLRSKLVELEGVKKYRNYYEDLDTGEEFGEQFTEYVELTEPEITEPTPIEKIQSELTDVKELVFESKSTSDESNIFIVGLMESLTFIGETMVEILENSTQEHIK